MWYRRCSLTWLLITGNFGQLGAEHGFTAPFQHQTHVFKGGYESPHRGGKCCGWVFDPGVHRSHDNDEEDLNNSQEKQPSYQENSSFGEDNQRSVQTM